MAFTLQQLRHFVAVAETGSISRGAERCHISQPSLSNSLRNLANLLSCQLLVRQPHGVVLSTDGELFLGHAYQILAAVDRATDEILSKPRSLAGELKLGVTDSFTGTLLPSLLAQAKRHFPKLTLNVIENDHAWMQSALVLGEVDLALQLLSNAPIASELSIEPLIASPRKLWTSADHPILLQGSISLRDVAACDFILLERDDHEQATQTYWKAHGLRPNIILRSKSVEAIRSLVAQGYGVTILSDLTYREWSNDGAKVIRRTLSDVIPTMDLGLTYLPGSDKAAAQRAFIQFLKTFIRTFSARIG